MEESQFIKYITSWFEGAVLRYVALLNSSKKALTYMNRTLLNKEFSLSGTWQTFNSTYTRVAADIVALDSDVPLKKRDAISKASGEIPKIAMKMHLNEKQILDLQHLEAIGGFEQQIVRSLFQDTQRVIEGGEERIEEMFLQGLSTGEILVDEDQNTGTGIRLNFGYADDHQLGVAKVWSDSTATPWVSDIEPLIAKANDDGNPVTTCYLDRTAYNALIANAETKDLYAFNIGFVGSAPIPNLNLDKLNSIAQSQTNPFTFVLVDRTVVTEKNGVRTSHKPWADGRLVFTGEGTVGSLVWSRVAEMGAPVAGVAYQTANEYGLVSKYRKNEPSLQEVTKYQAAVIPVISNVDTIYTLDTKTVEA